MTPPAKKTGGRKPPAKKTTRESPAVRDRRVLDLRRKGKTFEAIAKQLRFRDPLAVHAAYERALAAAMPQTPDQVRRGQLDQVAVQEEKLWPKADEGDLAAIAGLVELVLERQRIQATPAPLESKRRMGPVETATKEEADRLHEVAPALAATALVLARVVDDNSESEPGYTATAAHQLRMHMSQLRGLAGTRPPKRQEGPTPPDGEGDQAGDGKGSSKGATVTQLDLLRQRAAERARERTS